MMDVTTAKQARASIRDYYGRVLQRSSHLKTDACCTPNGVPPYLKSIVEQLDDAIVERYYGCGSPIPTAIEGCTVLDLGCGTGRDAFICSKLAGPHGRVIGLDMTPQQLDVAWAHEQSQARAFGYTKPNTRFVQGYMEELGAAGIEDDSVDVVISNCVTNLSPDKEQVFSEIFRVLKPGGELFFSDIFADRRLPTIWREDPVLLGECLAGAMYIEDFRRLLLSLGVPDYRVVARRPVAIDNEEVQAKIGMARFESVTIRAFKIASLEDKCEDFGQVATYLGTIAHCPHSFMLDDHHEFNTGKPMLVCGNTAAMVAETRFAAHFRVSGDRSQHFGLFPCGPAESSAARSASIVGGCC